MMPSQKLLEIALRMMGAPRDEPAEDESWFDPPAVVRLSGIPIINRSADMQVE